MGGVESRLLHNRRDERVVEPARKMTSRQRTVKQLSNKRCEQIDNLLQYKSGYRVSSRTLSGSRRTELMTSSTDSVQNSCNEVPAEA